MEKIKSPVTGSYNTKVLKSYATDHFVQLYKTSINTDVTRFFEGCEEVRYVKCLDSGYKFFYPHSICGDDLLYEDLQQFEWYYHQEKWEFEEALKYVNSKNRILEIGAGDGAFLNKLRNNKNLIDALEFNDAAIKSLKKQGYNAYNQLIQNFSDERENYYDVIVFFQVLEHVADVKPFLEAAIRSLKKGGKLIISVPNNRALIIRLDKNLSLNFPPHHIGHWDEESFKNLQSFLPIKLLNIFYEPLLQQQYNRYYRVVAIYLRNKFGLLGRMADKIIYPISYRLVKLLSKKLKGQSMVVIFTKE